VKPSRLIDPADRLRIERAVLEAERETAGEMVVAVLRACDAYTALPWRLGVVLAALVGLGAWIFGPPLPAPSLLTLEAAGLALGHGLGRLGAVRRLLAGEARLDEAVARRTQRAFMELGLGRTAGRTGILILVALLEHRVVVLGDEGVSRVLDPDESWEQVVGVILSGIRQKRLVDGLLEGVQRCGDILARHLPAPPRNLDEVPRALVLED
jgi:putative membrane protein